MAEMELQKCVSLGEKEDVSIKHIVSADIVDVDTN